MSAQVELAADTLKTLAGRWGAARVLIVAAIHLVAAAAVGPTPASALKVSVAIPELVKLNEPFWLNCSARVLAGRPSQRPQLEGEVYSLKWYKDDVEFYRFLPSAEPKLSVYETNGIQLDLSKSHEGNVLLSKAELNTEGNYRCEIVSEAPDFETVRKSKHLKVYALPVRGPRIEILDSSGSSKPLKEQEITYAVGDKIELRCNSAPSKPAAKLRWYLNDRELIMPPSSSAANPSDRIVPLQHDGHDVRLTPVEYRQHFKGIVSSHSSLSLVLQQSDLGTKNKISFKCLASLRQEVQVQGKQLIVLTPQPSGGSLAATDGRSLRSRRLLPLAAAAERTATQRHSVSRLQPMRPIEKLAGNAETELIGSLADDPTSQMMYVYEESDSSLGQSIIDSPETLERYLNLNYTARESEPVTYQKENSVLEYNKADNLEYVQMLRDKNSRQRTLPSSSINGTSIPNTHRKLYGPSLLVKSPLYLDEIDALRPIISWPPFESGKLLILPPGNSIIAIPTQSAASQSASQNSAVPWPAQNELRFVLPPSSESPSSETTFASLRAHPIRANKSPSSADLTGAQHSNQIILAKLIDSLNCTCAEGSIDTKLGWIINETPISTRDTRFFPTRVSPDHRQTWITIGLQAGLSSKLPTSLLAILAKYYQNAQPTEESLSLRGGKQFIGSSQQVQSASAASNQIRFACQATHPMLLSSNSEMITFDFNPPALNKIDGNSIDSFQPSPSNVIQATSASQSSSSGSLIVLGASSRSHTVLTVAMMCFASSWLIKLSRTNSFN